MLPSDGQIAAPAVQDISTHPSQRNPFGALLGLRALLSVADIGVGLLVTVMAHGFRDDAAVMAAAFVVGFRCAGLHRARLNPSLLEELPRLLGALLASTGAVLLVRVLLDSAESPRPFLRLVGFEALGVVLGRAAVYTLVRRARAARLVAHRTLLVGQDETSLELAQALLDHPEHGLLPVGFVDGPVAGAVPRARIGGAPRPALPLLGDVDALPRLIREHDAKAVIVVFPAAPRDLLTGALRVVNGSAAQVFVVPGLFEMHTQHHLGDSVRGIPLIRLHRSLASGFAWRAKRAMDVLVAFVALVAVAPLLALVASAVRLDSGPGVLFRQQRIGRDGRHFDVLKFRSLRPASEHESKTQWSVAQDDRLTSLGRLLRKTSLDELPQLWNILRGDMTLVGPRPERPFFVEKFSHEHPDYASRHRMPAGLTGWAAVNGLRGDTSIRERARYDNYYIENWSLWLDVTVLLKTLSSVFRGAGG